MRFGKVKSYVNECIVISIIKFILVPSVIFTIAIFLDYGVIEGGLPLKVVIILSSMPVSFPRYCIHICFKLRFSKFLLVSYHCKSNYNLTFIVLYY